MGDIHHLLSWLAETQPAHAGITPHVLGSLVICGTT